MITPEQCSLAVYLNDDAVYRMMRDTPTYVAEGDTTLLQLP